MAATSSRDREARERLRAYQARQTVHDATITRRRRDNLLAVIGTVVVAALATASFLLYSSVGPGAPAPDPSATAEPTPEPTAEAPDPALSENRTWRGSLTLNDIELGIELDGEAAPQAVAAIVTLAQDGFYDGLSCHRLTSSSIFVLQCGDPAGDGTGGPDFRFGPVEAAPADSLYTTGTLAMARAGNDGFSMGSQFFIVYGDSAIPTDEAGGYTVLGQVTSGLDQLTEEIIAAGAVDGAPDGPPAIPTTITSITIE